MPEPKPQPSIEPFEDEGLMPPDEPEYELLREAVAQKDAEIDGLRRALKSARASIWVWSQETQRELEKIEAIVGKFGSDDPPITLLSESIT